LYYLEIFISLSQLLVFPLSLCEIVFVRIHIIIAHTKVYAQIHETHEQPSATTIFDRLLPDSATRSLRKSVVGEKMSLMGMTLTM